MSEHDPTTNAADSNGFDPDELLDLAADECEGELDAARLARLEALLGEHPEARRQYLRYRSMQAQLALAERTLLSVGWRERLADEASNLAVDAIVEDDEDAARDDDVERDAREVIAAPAARWWTSARAGWSIAAALLIAIPLIVIAVRPAAQPVPDDAPPTAAEPLRGNFSLQAHELRGTLESGVQIVATPPTEVRIESGFDATLVSGTLEAVVPPEGSGFAVTTPSVRIVDLGTRFRATVDEAGHTRVDVLEGVVTVAPRHRLPRFYLDFNEPAGSGGAGGAGATGDAVVNRIDGSTHPFGAGSVRVDGPIGGALRFDNTPAAGVTLGPEGFDAVVGMTIEAVIVPEWSGKRMDYDEVFRKENRGRRLILLAFQHDPGTTPAVPHAVANAPCLSFGLALDGREYEELDMPLDGREGRPTLADLTDGKPHHVAATYDAATGVKALYIDGRLVYRHRYPAGTRIVSAGDAPGVVGNITPGGGEPFAGIIDEFAFYDFALSAEQVAAHHEAVKQGRHYFSAPPIDPPADDERTIRLDAPATMRFHAVTGLPIAE